MLTFGQMGHSNVGPSLMCANHWRNDTRIQKTSKIIQILLTNTLDQCFLFRRIFFDDSSGKSFRHQKVGTIFCSASKVVYVHILIYKKLLFSYNLCILYHLIRTPQWHIWNNFHGPQYCRSHRYWILIKELFFFYFNTPCILWPSFS